MTHSVMWYISYACTWCLYTLICMCSFDGPHHPHEPRPGHFKLPSFCLTLLLDIHQWLFCLVWDWIVASFPGYLHFGGCSFQLVQIGQLFACDGGATPKQRTGTKEYGAIIICMVTIRLHNHFFSILAMCPAVQPNVLCVSNRLQSGKLSCVGCNTIFIKYIIITLFCHTIATGGLPAIIHSQENANLSDGPWFLLT